MRTLLCALLLLLAGCQAVLAPLPAWQSPVGREHADAGQIVELRTGQRLTPEQLVQRLAPAPRVLVGERHDNPDHHALQLWLLRSLASQRAPGSLLLEMLTPGQQAAVGRAQQRLTTGEQVDDLPTALAWQKGWDWSWYGAIIRYALAQPQPVLAANLDRSEIMDIYQNPPVLTGTLSTAEAVRTPLLEQIRESHCGLLPESQMAPMLAIQQQRDRRMAEALLAAPEPAVLLAGAFHTRRDLGVPLHLRDLGDATGGQVLIFAEVGADPISVEQADFVWYTPATPEQDHCAKLRR